MRVFIIIFFLFSLSFFSVGFACQSGEPSFVEGVKRLVGEEGSHSFFVWFEGGIGEVNQLLLNSGILFELPQQEVPTFKSRKAALKGRVARDKVLLLIYGEMVLGAWEFRAGRLASLKKFAQNRCGPGSTPGFIR